MQTRRDFLRRSAATAGVLLICPAMSKPQKPLVDLDWIDLVPEADGIALEVLRSRGIIQHGELNTPFEQEREAEVTEEYNGERVRIPGYLVPLDFEEQGVTSALLVPYFGACIHVPPPPPNQLILVTVETPYKSGIMFEPVWAIGTFGTTVTSTELAEVGYSLTEATISPYSW